MQKGFQDAMTARLSPIRRLPFAFASDLKAVIGLHSVSIRQVDSEGKPYIGFEFGGDRGSKVCLAVLMHGARLVDIAGANPVLFVFIRVHSWFQPYIR